MKYEIKRQTVIEESCVMEADTMEQAEQQVSNADYKDACRTVSVQVRKYQPPSTATGYVCDSESAQPVRALQ